MKRKERALVSVISSVQASRMGNGWLNELIKQVYDNIIFYVDYL